MGKLINFKLPYGKEKIDFNVEENRVLGVLTSNLHNYVALESKESIVKNAMENPIGTEKLEVLAKGKNKVCLIASDHTRPVPSKVIVPQMLKAIRKGNPNADVTILIATGLHRTTTKDELIAKFGEEIVANEKIIIHDCYCTKNRFLDI